MFPARPPRQNPQLCQACRQPFLEEDELGFDFCGRSACLTRRQLERPELNQLRQAREARWLEVTQRRTAPLLDAVLSRLETPASEAVTGLVPFVDRPLVPLPADRRASFETHLRQVVDNSFTETPEGSEPLPPKDDPDYAQRAADEAEEPSVLNAACIACRGDCCLPGGTHHAFLSARTIDRFRWRHPSARAKDVISYYLAALPDESVQGSCVYHGAFGCTLKREDRSSICNTFLCWFRRELDKDHARKPGYGEVVVAIARTHTQRQEEDAPCVRVVSVAEDGVLTEHTDLKLPALSDVELAPFHAALSAVHTVKEERKR
ncbi:hypothetical protein MGEO_18085 [Marivita geojedonensis]|uniref:Uncharacterized protein n=1 Tax=Marivita geojedonensis TaxID=1123756 RepID=A0A1X4NF42_9RHOB|nr:hypothetical protein MGEO_18085 [Marivita geojedonensis]PRY73962.1 hypothetical protein CLV76_12530 [Marivita geojedonensis]